MNTLTDTPNGFPESCNRLLNMSDEETERLMDQLSSTTYSQYWIYFGWMPIPLTCLTAACTVAYILAICAAMKTRRVSRKCYMLLLNRAVGDLLCCAFFFCCSAYIFLVSADQFRADILLIIATLCGGCYWTAMVSYVSLSVLKLFAVYKPLKYKKVFSMSHCLHLITLSWLIYALAVIVTLTAAAFVRVPSLRKWSGCKRETCMHALQRAKTVVISVVYVFTLIVYISTVITLRTMHHSSENLQKKIEKGNSYRLRKRFPFWKLTLNVSTFAIFNLAYIIASIILMPRNRCHVFVNHYENAGLIGAIWLSLLVRILIDAVLGLCTDRQLRERMVSLSHATSSGQNIPGGKRKVADQCLSFPHAESASCEAEL